jgi:ferric-dicitrate binding protein FerR (iron transport regulator)
VGQTLLSGLSGQPLSGGASKVERNGATELHVLEGEVAYSKPGTLPEAAQLLGAGKAVRYDQPREQAPRTRPAGCSAV